MTQTTRSTGPRPHRRLMPAWRREALRTTLWVVPSVMTAAAVVLFLVTYRIDLAVAGGRIALPSWAITGQADATRAVLIGIAAAVITVVGVVFSITIIALQLASQQFGPRMLRNFIRDLGTQVSLGAFVATFVYSILTLGSVAHGSSGDFVPHISVTIALVLTLGDLGVLIFFIHHVATSIQVTTVVAGIARDFRSTLAQVLEEAGRTPPPADEEAERQELMLRLESGGELVPARTSGFLQSVGHEELVRIATTSDAVIRLLHRAGHFVVEGQALALVWPSSAVEGVTTALDRAHIVGSNRTLNQDPGFAVDQLVEVAIRALSPAVNDTFTAMNCIDWLGDCLCRAARRPLPSGLYRDDDGVVRLIDPTITFKRLVQKASDKIRQAGRGMPAVLIRQLENLEKVTVALADPAHRAVIDHEAGMILRSSEEAIPEASDREDVLAAYRSLHAALGAGSAPAR